MWQITTFAHHLMLFNLHSASSVSPYPESDRSQSTTFPTNKGVFLLCLYCYHHLPGPHFHSECVFFTVRNTHIVSIVWRMVAGDTNFSVHCLLPSTSVPLVMLLLTPESPFLMSLITKWQVLATKSSSFSSMQQSFALASTTKLLQ